ncbi:MAG: hypothetical protein SGJ24_08775 [Chloroflexota bacterium]|nr:hypothetical protein [Chloroflexota bacterium]
MTILQIEDVSAVRRHRRAHDRVVPFERSAHGVRILIQEAGAAFDVGD